MGSWLFNITSEARRFTLKIHMYEAIEEQWDISAEQSYFIKSPPGFFSAVVSVFSRLLHPDLSSLDIYQALCELFQMCWSRKTVQRVERREYKSRAGKHGLRGRFDSPFCCSKKEESHEKLTQDGQHAGETTECLIFRAKQHRTSNGGLRKRNAFLDELVQ